MAEVEELRHGSVEAALAEGAQQRMMSEWNRETVHRDTPAAAESPSETHICLLGPEDYSRILREPAPGEAAAVQPSFGEAAEQPWQVQVQHFQKRHYFESAAVAGVLVCSIKRAGAEHDAKRNRVNNSFVPLGKCVTNREGGGGGGGRGRDAELGPEEEGIGGGGGAFRVGGGGGGMAVVPTNPDREPSPNETSIVLTNLSDPEVAVAEYLLEKLLAEEAEERSFAEQSGAERAAEPEVEEAEAQMLPGHPKHRFMSILRV